MIKGMAGKFLYYTFRRLLSGSVLLFLMVSTRAQTSKDTVAKSDIAIQKKLQGMMPADRNELYTGNTKLVESDSVAGFHRYWYRNGQVAMEGKITKGTTTDYKDSVWNYYDESGLLQMQEVYSGGAKLNSKEFTYFANHKPMGETYEYYEGYSGDEASIGFHIIEKMYYSNGQQFSYRHIINNTIVEVKCWDSKGNPMPASYMKKVKSLTVKD